MRIDKEKKRDNIFDVMRALCTLWIVGIWHIKGYMSDETFSAVLSTPLALKTTYGVLATFTFIGGYFSYRVFNGFRDILRYYGKRLLRIYPLFAFSAVSLSLTGYLEAPTLLPILLGVGCLIRPFPLTIWYICMIMLFYLITPVISKNSIISSILFSIAIEAIIVLLYVKVEIDGRLCFYWIFYAMGSMIRRLEIDKYMYCVLEKETCGRSTYTPWLVGGVLSIIINKLTILCLVMSFPLFVLLGNCDDNLLTVRSIITACMFVIMLYGIAFILSRVKQMNCVAEWIACGSLCVYLFHRQLFWGCYLIRGGAFSVVEAYFVVIPLVFIIGYMIQRLYDNTIVIIKN